MLSFKETEQTASIQQKLFAALSYAVASTLIMFVNKTALTSYNFPSYAAIAAMQYATSCAIMLFQRYRGTIFFGKVSVTVLWEVLPLSLIFFGNTLTGLGATKKLNMPLFVLLRRFSIVMTLCLEVWLLNKRFPPSVVVAVSLMVLGALITSSYDLSYDMSGVVMILLNDAFTALQGVVLRKKMDQHTIGTHGIMFYNNAFSFPLAAGIVLLNPPEVRALVEFPHWGNIVFLLCFISTGVMGFVINYFYYLCTKCNSPLTTTVIGAGKNIATSYLGMIFKDYQYSHFGFVGVNVSVIGSLLYNYAEWAKIRLSETVRQQQSRMVSPETVIVSVDKERARKPVLV